MVRFMVVLMERNEKLEITDRYLEKIFARSVLPAKDQEIVVGGNGHRVDDIEHNLDRCPEDDRSVIVRALVDDHDFKTLLEEDTSWKLRSGYAS